MALKRAKARRELEQLCLEAGADRVEFSVTGGTHLRMRVTKDGSGFTYFMPSSPGKGRSEENSKADVRRMLRLLDPANKARA